MDPEIYAKFSKGPLPDIKDVTPEEAKVIRMIVAERMRNFQRPIIQMYKTTKPASVRPKISIKPMTVLENNPKNQ